MKTRVLITGASSGLGREMAVQLARRGWRVAITGRRQDKLASAAAEVEAAGGECLPLLGDVTDRDAVRRHYAAVRERWGGLDWAILNAGVSERNDAREFSADACHWTFATNVGGAANWLEAVLPDMIKAGSGTVAGIASLAAFRGFPRAGAYCASKSALVALLESARVDLRGTGIQVVTVCPGFVKSELTDRNEPGGMPFLMETEDGARAILRGIEKGKALVHFPWQLSILVRHVIGRLPCFLFDPLMARFGVRKKKPYADQSKLPPSQVQT